MPLHPSQDCRDRPAGTDGPAAGIAPTGGELTNLQLLRALAASLVLVHHVTIYGQAFHHAGKPFTLLDAVMGVSGIWGVAIFFALSGFLMARLVNRDPPVVFLAHRISRIYPTYFAVLALSAAIFAALGLEFGGVSALALSLAPGGQRSYPFNVEWTLVLELSFYVGLFLLASAGRAARIVPLAAAWLAVLAVGFVALPPGSRNEMPPTLYLLPLTSSCAAFAGGLLLPRLIASGWIRPAWALLALPFAAACIPVDGAAARWLAGIAAVLLVGAAVTARPVSRNAPATRGLILLGDWSYVLYLVHPPVLILAAWACPPHWPGPAYAGVAIAGALAATALLGPLDVAFYRRLRRWIDGTRPAVLNRGAAVFLLVFSVCALWGSVETARHDWADAGARRALAALPAGAWLSPSQAAQAIAQSDRALPSSLRAALEAIEPLSPEEDLVSAYAFDPARPDRVMRLALVCDGRVVAVDRPRRRRGDLAGRPGFETLGGRRTGYRIRIPAKACSPDTLIAVAVDADGRMAVLGR